MDKFPKVGVGVIVLKEGKVLMQKRRDAHGIGTWSFFGGHLELNETPESCAKREALEELGVVISDIKTVGFTNDIFQSEGKHYITIFVVANSFEGEPRICEPDRTSEIGWFSWSNLPKPLFLPIENLLLQGFNPLDFSKA